MTNFNLITDALIRVQPVGGAMSHLSLPEVMAALAADRIAGFPGLRSHQAEPWHVFLVQLAALALLQDPERGQVVEPPQDAGTWAARLRGLTPDGPDDASWSLVADDDAPAFLQSPVPKGCRKDYRSRAVTPDELDMVPTARDFDLKQRRMTDAELDGWIYALVTLQTFEGYMGRGNFGIARMNGGFASRPVVGIVPPGGPGARFCRDLRVLQSTRDERLRRYENFGQKGWTALGWLAPWDGRVSMEIDRFDPWWIEICRRVRLRADASGAAGLVADLANSDVARVEAKAQNGNLGDPWTPVDRRDKQGLKAFTVPGDGFGYRRMVDLLSHEHFEPAPCQDVQAGDGDSGLRLRAWAIARGQGKTDGMHRRDIPIPAVVVRQMRRKTTDRIAEIGRQRVQEIGKMSGPVLRWALFALLQDGRDSLDLRHAETGNRVQPWLDRFDGQVDRGFFPALWAEVAEEDREKAGALRMAWHGDLARNAFAVLTDASASLPVPAIRRYRAQVRAESMFRANLGRHFGNLGNWRRGNDDDRAA